MHLLPPMFSTTGKKKGPKKWASAEAKARSEKLDADWKAMLKQQGIKSENKKQKRALSAPAISVSPKIPPGRETPYIASQDTGWVTCAPIKDTEYTGSAVLGISVLHKSNGVPVFSKQDAVDISKMRR